MQKDIDLYGLREKKEQEKRLTVMLRDLQSQKEKVEQDVALYDEQRKKEEADVEKLESGGLRSFLYTLKGRKEERLEQEKAEALAAQVKYEKAVLRLEEVERNQKRMEQELAPLVGSNMLYAKALEKKAERLKESNGESAQRICAIEEEFDGLVCLQKELREALVAGEVVLEGIHKAKGSLGSAEGWGVFDMMGGGLMSTMVKHSHLDAADGELNRLQEALSRYRTELADVTVRQDLQVNLDGFSKFADYFFDNILFDWMVQSEISKTQKKVQETELDVESVQSKLRRLQKEAAIREDTLQKEWEELLGCRVESDRDSEIAVKRWLI